jgi:multisubunit Na+/H+ antiporter MnhC subunit
MLRLNYFDEQRAGITLSSDPIRLELTRGSEENVDIDSDGNPDIIVVYEGKNNYRAQIHLKEIKTPAPSTSTEQQSSKETSSLPSQSKLPRIIIGLGIIAFILIWFIFTRRKTPQTSLEWLKYNN